MDTSTPSSPSWPLSWFELPSLMVAPALRACRLFNTSLDGLFYDVPGLTQALRERDVRILTTRDGDGPLPNGVIDLSAATDPEGALLLIDPSAAPYITAWTNVAAFLESQATAPNPVGVATITGVGSSALGSAAMAWDVAVGLARPVLAIVPGYGVADVMLQGLGGWFGFGLHDRLNIKSDLQNTLAVVAPNTATHGRRLSASSPGARTVNGGPVFRTGCGSSDVLHDLMRELRFTHLVGHSKGALAIANALRDLPPGRTKDLKVVTLGCPIAEERTDARYHQ